MNWNNGFSAAYYLRRVDPATWRDMESYDLTGGNISRSDGDLMEAADLEMTNVPESGEAWVRLWLHAKQSDDGVLEAIFTGLLSAPSVKWDGIRKERRVECYSVLKPAADVLLDRGWYAPSGANGARIAASLLSAGAAPVEYEDGSPVLLSSIVAEDGETKLTMAQKILEAIGWRIRISGMGVIRICPKAEETVITFDAAQNDSIELSVEDTQDWFNCPNVFRAISDDMTAIARDDDPESIFSTVSRGREIWMEEQDCNLNAGESIAEYALRRLKEEQAPARTISYNRRFWPDLTIGDLIRLNHPAQGISGIFRILSQRIDLSYGASTAEEVVRDG